MLVHMQRLSKKTAVTWMQLELLCSPQANYRAYRGIEQGAQAPFIPFIGMHLRDMVFMNDGNAVQLPNGLFKCVGAWNIEGGGGAHHPDPTVLGRGAAECACAVPACPSCVPWRAAAWPSWRFSTGPCTPSTIRASTRSASQRRGARATFGGGARAGLTPASALACGAGAVQNDGLL